MFSGRRGLCVVGVGVCFVVGRGLCDGGYVQLEEGYVQLEEGYVQLEEWYLQRLQKNDQEK